MLVLSLFLSVAAAATLPTAEQIVERVRDAEIARHAQMEKYVAVRRYELTNHRFRKSAKIMARITYQNSGEKTFEVISEEGSRIIRDRVLRRAIEAETDSSRTGGSQTKLDFTNYDIQVLGMETLNGRDCYLISLAPKSKSPYLIKGKGWIDAIDYALIRAEGNVAKKPSVWVGNPVVVQTYLQSGPFWLPERNFSRTDAPVFGKTDLMIESSGYEVHRRQPKE